MASGQPNSSCFQRAGWANAQIERDNLLPQQRHEPLQRSALLRTGWVQYHEEREDGEEGDGAGIGCPWAGFGMPCLGEQRGGGVVAEYDADRWEEGLPDNAPAEVGDVASMLVFFCLVLR